MKDITIRRPVVWKSVQATDVGLVREVNEDAILSLPKAQIWAVADGMGGHEAGDVASRMTIAALEDIVPDDKLSALVDEVEDRLLDVNHRILEYADIMLDGATIGSTIVSLSIKGRLGICLWVGDSRLYRFRNRELLQLSRDHSHVEEMIQQGYITADNAQDDPDANVITRAVGTDPELYVDINLFSTQLGDIFLLCSDGLYNLLSKEEIADTLGSATIDDAVERLLQMALEKGANDNVSIILVKGEQRKDVQLPQAAADVVS